MEQVMLVGCDLHEKSLVLQVGDESQRSHHSQRQRGRTVTTSLLSFFEVAFVLEYRNFTLTLRVAYDP